MFRRIVVAYNAGNEGRDALALATRLARLDRARIVVVQAMPLSAGPNAARETATRMTAARASIAQVVPLDVELEYRPCVTRAFAASVHAAAAREDADLVVAGQSRLGPIARARLGGGAELLLAGSRWPIAVAPPEQAQRPPFHPRLIGVGFDGSPGAALALRAAAGLARRFGAGLRVIAVGGSACDARAAAERLAGDVGVVGVSAPAGDPARALLGEAARGVDALVVGHRERRPGHGGVAERVMGGAGCPVWVVPPGAAALALRPRAAAAAAA